MSALAVAFLLSVTSPSLWKGVRSTQSLMGPLVSDYSHQLLTELKEGQSVFLEESVIGLNETLFVDASNVEIRGAPGMTTVHCPEHGGAFVVRGTNVTLANLKIIGCKEGSALTVDADVASPSGQKKASKHNKAGTSDRLEVRIESCVFAENAYFKGAAISVAKSRLLVWSSRFLNNQARFGGAIYARIASLHIQDCEVKHNSATNGGAVMGIELEASIDGVNFEENVAADLGGALCFQSSKMRLSNTTLAKNSALLGGALAGNTLEATIDLVDFKQNGATDFGGGLYLKNSTATLTNSALTKNRAATLGGALAGDGLEVMLDGVEFEDNVGEMGGALCLKNSKAMLRNAILVKNNAAALGGALVGDGLEVMLDGVVFERNTADTGGALCFQDSKATLKNSTLAKNYAATQGGALAGESLEATIDGVNFEENVADEGGALCLGNSVAALRNSILVKNNASFGGAAKGVMIAVAIDSVDFKENVATDFGGALYLKDSKATLRNSALVENKASVNHGFTGTIYSAV